MSKNPVHSVFFLVLVFFSATALLILLEVDYLAMVLLIVYVGAIAVLFLFVIMLLNLKVVELQENFYRYLPLSGFLALIFLLEVFLLLQKEFNGLSFWSTGLDYFSWINSFFDFGTSLDKLSVLIYNYFFFLFILCGLLLFVAMIGAIVLTVFQSSYVKKQDIIIQLQRDIKKTVVVL
jgi:NADH-quinone oxidoreductase subunit J